MTVTGGDSSTSDDAFVVEMLRGTAREFLEANVRLEDVAADADASQRELHGRLWPEIAEMGWIGVGVPEELGGAGLGLAAEAVLHEECGRALFPGAFLTETALAAPALLTDEAGLSRLVGGEATFAVAWAEPGGPMALGDVAAVRCAAARGESGWTVNGTKTQVIDGDLADELIVVARDAQGPALFSVDCGAPGITREPCPSSDGTRRLTTIRLENVPAQLIASGEQALIAVARMRTRALLAIAYESLGLAERILADAVAYACAREQFGRPIGAFQAISVPLADRYVEVASARILAQWAVAAIAADDPHAGLAAEIAKTQCAEAARHTAEVASQVFGAIAFTWEHHLHRYLRRALFNERFEFTPRSTAAGWRAR